ncbi:MAG: response regulator [Clostridia bacterium]|nr:response regulator [Clostridia bacterium]
MRVLLADDEKLQLLRLENVVRKVLPAEYEVSCYVNPVLAWEENEDKRVDLAFLDIEMPVLNGIGLAKKLKKNNPQVNIIFVTAYDHYALDAYKLHASGYVTKPVNAEMVRAEVEALRYPVEMKARKKLQVKCFGNFEVFSLGAPLNFRYAKTKELFAYLVDREGAAVNVNELNAILWEEDHKSYLRNLIADLRSALRSVDAEDALVNRRNAYSVDPEKLDCDAYSYAKNDPDAVRAYRGEYMAQYSWAMFDSD